MADDPAPAQRLFRFSGPLGALRQVGERMRVSGAHGIFDRLELQTPLGRARLARCAVWALLVLLALSAVTALFTAARAVGMAGRPIPVSSQAPALGAAGWAESYVATYVAAGAGREDRLRPYLADPPALDARADSVRAVWTAVTAARQVRPGYWSITVAADLAGRDERGRWRQLGTRFFQVAVVAAAGGHGGYIATGLPAVVAGPAAITKPRPGYDGSQLPATAPAFQMVVRFLNAYLAGQGELVRYLAPGAGLVPVTPPPYALVTVQTVTSAPDRSSEPQAAGDAAAGPSQVLVNARGTDRAGLVQNLTYALRLTMRDGQWVVAALEDAPLLAPARKEHRP